MIRGGITIMKKEYSSVVIEIVGLHVSDVITSSPLSFKTGGDGDEFGFGSLFGN